MTTTADPPDPFANIPDPETIRRMISESVRRTQAMRRLLRVAESVADSGEKRAEDEKGASDAR